MNLKRSKLKTTRKIKFRILEEARLMEEQEGSFSQESTW